MRKYSPDQKDHVFRPEVCVYSNALDYSGEKGLLSDVIIVDL